LHILEAMKINESTPENKRVCRLKPVFIHVHPWLMVPRNPQLMRLNFLVPDGRLTIRQSHFKAPAADKILGECRN
jgi:hypothetical protein